jgi:hypothetical protein
MITVKYDELLSAFDFVSAGTPFENKAYICMDTGAIHWVSVTLDLEEEVPDDIETSNRYIAVPHKNDLDLGRNLALSFVNQELPDEYNTVANFFRHKGAYRRFKNLLETRAMLEKWLSFETKAYETALREWCQKNGIQLLGIA